MKKNGKVVVGSDDPNETIWVSCKLGDIEAVDERLKAGVNVNKPDSYGNTPLYYACLCGRYKMVEFLLGKGAQDDGVQRAYYNALTIDIRHLLKGIKTSVRNPEEPNSLKHREDDGQPYNFTVLLPIAKSKYDDAFSPMSPGVSQYFTDVVVKTDPKLQPQKEYKCHLCILLPRLYYLFNKYFKDVKYDDEKAIEDIIENKLKDKSITLNYRHEVVGMILKYLYTNDEYIFMLSKGFELDLIQALLDFGLNKEAKRLIKKVKKTFETVNNFPNYPMTEQLSAGMTSEKRKKFSKKAIETQIKKEIEKQNEELKKKKKELLSEKHKKKYFEEKYSIYSKASEDRIKLEHIMRYLSDVKLYSNDLENFYYCHKAILAARSAYFNILLGGYFSEVGESTSLEVSYDALETVVFFIYTDRCIIGSTAIEVLSAAHQLNLDGLKKKSGNYIGKNIDHTNAFDIFKLADMYNAPKLKLLCSNYFLTPQYQKTNLPDLKVYPVDKSTKFHDYKCILASHSKYFFDLFYYDETEYKAIDTDLSTVALSWFLKCYSGKHSLDNCPPRELCEILIFCDKLGFDVLGKKTRSLMQGSQRPIELLYFMFELKCEDEYLKDDLCYQIVSHFYGKHAIRQNFKDLVRRIHKRDLLVWKKEPVQQLIAKFSVYQKINNPNLYK
eukprot:gene7615-11938_t